MISIFLSLSLARGEILPEPTICADHNFKITTGKERPYSSEAKWGTASYACSDKEISWTCVAFVMDRMSGILRWSEDQGEPGPIFCL